MKNQYALKTTTLFLGIFILQVNLLLAQIPKVKAVAVSAQKMVDWKAVEKQYMKETQGQGPGYFYNDCSQGVEVVNASSTLPNQGVFNYKASNISDQNPLTAWVEGKNDYGIGEYLVVKAMGLNSIYNGYQHSPKSWGDNSRVKSFRVYKNNKAICILELLDIMGAQRFELPDHNAVDQDGPSVYKLEILEVYQGAKWSDVAITELDFVLCCFSEHTEISAPAANLSAEDLVLSSEVYAIDLERQKLIPAKITGKAEQKHLSLLSLKSASAHLDITLSHPVYIKNEGFLSIKEYMRKHKLDDFKQLENNLELLAWSETEQSLVYQKINAVELLEGNFTTYSITGLDKGSSYLANGFVTKTY